MRITLQNKDDLRNMAMLYSRVRVMTVVTLRFCTCRYVCLSCNRVKERVFALPLFQAMCMHHKSQQKH